MNMFIEVFDSKADQLINLNLTDIRTYSEQDVTDRQGNLHYFIVYALKENRYIEEEFNSTEERSAKLDQLAQFSA